LHVLLLLQLKAKGQLPAAAAAPADEEKKEEAPSFKAFVGKGFSLRG
jgi:hypothetical protein